MAKRLAISKYRADRLKSQKEVGSMDTDFYINYKAHHYPYVMINETVELIDKIEFLKQIDWCIEHFGQDAFDTIFGTFFFDSEDDATLFKLTWC